jgi:succinyl-CoA synthetase alpha subunit
MSILVDSDTRILIQGITGKQGSQACREIISYGGNVVGGVTPGKGGQEVEGLPVYNSVSEALANLGSVDVSMVYTPPLLVLDAAMEAVENSIHLIHLFAENVPVFDVCKILFQAKKRNVRILGPNSVGVISPGEGKIGSIGGPSPDAVFSKGPVGVVSKSGGMCSELGNLITAGGFGQSTVVGIGGDLLAGTSFSDVLLEFENDRETKIVVGFSEVGGSAEIEAAKLMKEGKFTKPFIIFLAGKFAEKLPKDTALGHAGAIVGLEATMVQKINILKDAGAIVAENFEDIPKLIKKAL